jgi:drug/metabolite transporter (DMT)-like permease
MAVAAAAIFIRYAQADGMPSLVIAAGRLTIAALVLTPFALARHLPAVRALNRRDLALAVVSGFFLAIHFAAWVSSLEYASVLISVVVVTSNSLFVVLLEVIFLRARPARLVIVGLVLAIVGGRWPGPNRR